MEKIDWVALAAAVGSIAPNGERWLDEGGMGLHERGGTGYAQRALEKIIDTENIRDAVNFIIEDGGPGSELAANVLIHIASLEALELAYERYKTGNPDLALYAVDLIQRINHPRSMDWIDEFLHDENPGIVVTGLAVLDQLVWSCRANPEDSRIDTWLTLVDSYENSSVQQKARDVRRIIEERRRENRR